MKIALAAEGTRGDIHPLLDAGERFRRRGHEVVLCAPPDFRAEVEERGLSFRPVGLEVRAFLETNSRIAKEGGLTALRIAYTWARDSLARQFDALPDAVQGCDRLIAGGVQMAAHSVAQALGIPYRYVAYCPALLRSAEFPPFIFTSQRMPRWLNRMLWSAFRKSNDLVLLGPLNRARAALSLPPVSDSFSHVLGDRPFVAAEAELAPIPRDVGHPVEQIGCLHRTDGPPLPEKLQSFLDAGPAPLFIGFGSMPDDDPDATTRTVLRAVERLGCRALLSEGWAGLGDGPLPEGVMRVGSVSHVHLFPRVAGVVHHGGAGTTTMAARCGVPQLVVPHLADQFYWGTRVSERGLGPPPLARTRVTRDALEPALAELLHNELLRERAEELGERLRGRADPEGDADRLLSA